MSGVTPPAPATHLDAHHSHAGRRHLSWPTRLPKTVLVTIGLTLLTAWLFPAISRQWQDRQKARELTAALVTQIGKETSQALVTSDFLSSNRLPSPTPGRFNQDAFNQLDLQWRTASAQIEAELQAYYSRALVDRWRTYSLLVRHTYFLPTEDKHSRPDTLIELKQQFGEDNWRHWNAQLLASPWVDQPGDHSAAVIAYLHISGALLTEKANFIDDLLRDHPQGFSTRPRDIFHDLFPF